MINSKIMSYITQDFQSRSDLIVGGEEWQKVVLEMQSKFAKAGTPFVRAFIEILLLKVTTAWTLSHSKGLAGCLFALLPGTIFPSPSIIAFGL